MTSSLTFAVSNQVKKIICSLGYVIRSAYSVLLFSRYVNHALYWAIMSPNPNNEERKPNGRVAQLIDETFGTYSNFQSIFENTALGVFGSGYAWLCLDVEQGGVKILGSTNQDSPLNQHGLLPILVIDVWEHAYYLKHQNRRAAYVKSFWNIINWDAVSELLEWWPKQIKHDEL